MGGRYIRQVPYVDNYGIYVPDKEYVPEGTTSVYRCIMTKDMFIEAYNRWIKNDVLPHGYGEDDADCWSDD